MEKIIVRAVKNPCAECKIKAKCTRKCMFFKMWKNGGISRKKAIDIMAKAIFEWQRPGCRGDVPIEDVWNNEQEGYEKLAETALNALLKRG